MRAIFVNENVTDIFKGKSIEEIVSSYNDINKLLIKAVEDKQVELINYAIKHGANQIWYRCAGPWGGKRSLAAPNITDSLVIIKKARYTGKEKNLNIVFELLYPVTGSFTDKIIRSSNMFNKVYLPINDYFINTVKLTKANIQKIENIIKIR